MSTVETMSRQPLDAPGVGMISTKVDFTGMGLETIEQAEKALLCMEQEECPVVHVFGPGVYVRGVKFKAGSFVIGHHQKNDQLNMMTHGKVAVLVDGDYRLLEAPLFFVGRPGRKVGIVLEDVVWYNIYPNPTDERDLDKLESTIFDRSEAWNDHHNREQDSGYSNFLKTIGINDDLVRMQSENADDVDLRPDLVPNVTIRETHTRGKGVFSPGGASMGEIIGPARINGMRTIIGRFANHSDDPNTFYRKDDIGDIYMVASRDIQGCLGGGMGEELTVDYRQSVRLAGVLVGVGI